MYNLKDTFEMQGYRAFLFVSEEPVVTAKVIRLHHCDGSNFDISDVDFGRFTQCFSNNQTQGFRTKTIVPEKYLQAGTRLELLEK